MLNPEKICYVLCICLSVCVSVCMCVCVVSYRSVRVCVCVCCVCSVAWLWHCMSEHSHRRRLHLSLHPPTAFTLPAFYRCRIQTRLSCHCRVSWRGVSRPSISRPHVMALLHGLCHVSHGSHRSRRPHPLHARYTNRPSLTNKNCINKTGFSFSFCFMTANVNISSSYHIYTSQWPVVNVKANFCAYYLWIKFWYLLYKSGGFYKKEKLKQVFKNIIFAILLVKTIINGFWNGSLLSFWIFRYSRLLHLLGDLLHYGWRPPSLILKYCIF